MDEIVIKSYLNGLGVKKISVLYNIPIRKIQKILKNNNISCFRNKNPIASFDVWNEKSAYFFGLLLSDGTFRKNKKIGYQINLRMIDKDIIEKFLVFLNLPPFRLKTLKYKSAKTLLYGVSSGNTHLCNQLINLGFPIGNKYNIISFPNSLPIDLYNHFIRGYFDGDGSVGIYNKKSSKINKTYRVSFTSSSFSFLEIIKKELNIKSSFQEKNNQCFTLQYSLSKDNFLKIRDYLYKDATVFLDRKHKKFFSI